MLPFPLIASEQDTQGNTHLHVLGMVLHKCTEWKAASTMVMILDKIALNSDTFCLSAL